METHADFVCVDCAADVIWIGPYDGVPRCNVCRYIKEHPEMPERIRLILRGKD